MPANSSSGPLGDLGDTLMSWLLLLGGAAAVLALGYIAYGLFFAAEVVFGGTGAQAANSQQILANLHLACTVMNVAGIALIVAALGRYWGFLETGAILFLVGLGLLIGMPYLIESVSSTYPPKSAAAAKTLLAGQFVLTGALYTAAGAIQLLIQGIVAFVNRGARAPRLSTDVSQGAFTGKKLERQDKFLGPCWTLPFCRDSAKRVCPVLHRRRPCWRDGHGCYCDQNIVMMLSGDRGRSASRSAQGFVSMQSLASGRPKSSAEKRAQCLACPIYLHRQNQKYRILAPTAIAVVAGFFLLNKLWLDEMYPKVIQNVGLALSRFAYSSGPGGPQVPDWAIDLGGKTTVEWMVVLVVGMLIVAYLLHSLEWALYKLGL